MSRFGFATSGFSFTKEEFHLQSQFKMMNWILLVVSLIVASMLIAHALEAHHTDTINIHVNELYLIICITLFSVLRFKKSNLFIVANLFLFFSFITFTSALIFVTNDGFRIIWFVLLLFVSYFISGKTAGRIIAFASLAVILVANELIDLNMNQTELISAFFGLIAANYLAHFYTSHNKEYEAFLFKENQTLTHLASTDTLTGIMNKRAFDSIAKQYFAIAQQHSQKLSLIVLDIDNFRSIREQHGHEIGDAILVKFSAIVQSLLNKNDLFARISGETFGILLLNTSLEDAYALSERIRVLIEAIDIEHEFVTLNLTCSIGVVNTKEDELEFSLLSTRANQALIHAKELGKNNTVKG